VRMLITGYAHAIQPISAFAPKPRFVASTNGAPVASFASIGDPHYQAMLESIREAAKKALASPRQDMPGADILPGAPRQFIAPPLPVPVPPLAAAADDRGTVQLSWEHSAATIGLEVEVHRADTQNFTPVPATLLTKATLFRHLDRQPSAAKHYYAIVFTSGDQRSAPAYAAVTVPPSSLPPANLKDAAAKSPQTSAR
jgi:hypothetical protein